MSFDSLGLSPALLRAVRERGYGAPTAVQLAALPAAMKGQDLLVSAQTGSGKTAAFALPIVRRLEAADTRQTPRRLQALVLVPTRELAAQVGESIRALAAHLADPVKVAIVFGGVSINPQMMGLRGGAEVVVATPGRLLDLVEHNALRLDGVAMLVLDEADRLLDAGFADELSRIVTMLPGRRQTLMFSATISSAVEALAQGLLHAPVRIDVPAEVVPQPAITQRALAVDAPRRTQLLRKLIVESNWTRVLVFVATRHASDHVASKLRALGLETLAFHGDMSQGARTAALADFKSGLLRVLVATDVAARGIDVKHLSVVVNYDLPRAAPDHLHRIGRTGRAGASGLAISFVSADNEAHFRLIEKRQGQRVAREQISGFEPVEVATEAVASGGVKGKRKSKKDRLRERLTH